MTEKGCCSTPITSYFDDTLALRRYAGVLHSVIPLGGDVRLTGPRMLLAMILARGFRWISDAQIRAVQYSTASQFCKETTIHVGSYLPAMSASLLLWILMSRAMREPHGLYTCQQIQAEPETMCCAYIRPLPKMPASRILRCKAICKRHTMGIGRSVIATFVTRFKPISARKKARMFMQCPGIAKFQNLSTGVHWKRAIDMNKAPSMLHATIVALTHL